MNLSISRPLSIVIGFNPDLPGDRLFAFVSGVDEASGVFHKTHRVTHGELRALLDRIEDLSAPAPKIHLRRSASAIARHSGATV